MALRVSRPAKLMQPGLVPILRVPPPFTTVSYIVPVPFNAAPLPTTIGVKA